MYYLTVLKIKFEKYSSLKSLEESKTQRIVKEISLLIENSWGYFPDDFIIDHISNSSIILARVGEKCVGFCSVSVKKILRKKIYYIEFISIDKLYQRNKLSSNLFFKIIQYEMIKNIHQLLIGRPLEIFFITPNVRTLSHIAKFASFLYPNPYHANRSGQISYADDETWIIAKEILRISDNPNRRLDRNGLVLQGSYTNMPWLIYNNDNAPWHSDRNVNLFAEEYLGYKDGSDKEFIVRAQISIRSVFKYLFYKFIWSH